MKKWKAPEKKSLGQALKEKDSARIVHYALRFIVVLVLVAQLFNGNYENVFLCLLTLLLFTIPSLIETNTRIDIPDTLENLIFFFIPQRSERKGISMMVPLPSECRESKVRYPVPWGGKGGNAS